jgi:hypothetical protein
MQAEVTMGNWLSGPCSDDEPGTFVVFERPEAEESDEPEPDDLPSLLREMAAEPDSDLVEISPHVWYQSKLHQRGEMPSDRDKLA